MLFVLFMFPALAGAGEAIQGPILARVVDVYDGDTFTAEARTWLGQVTTTKVRIAGIDTPEIRRPKCDSEKRKAIAAKEALRRLLGDSVYLRNIKRGKYAGRVISQVISKGGIDIGKDMIRTGHARPYSGGKRGSWCN
tara:strand:+ start:2517 stop:2930 length:414 start_codon:yes stop_codon:yes gene_type:complete